MRYQEPVGKLPGAPYVNGNRSAGLRGDTPPAAAIEHPMRELDHLIQFAGLTPSADDLEQVRKAIELIVESMTGGGAIENYLTLLQASSRLPFYPEILTGDGKINVTSPGAGSVIVPPTVSFLHRGIAPHNTSDYDEPERTFATLAGRTYHLRWTPSAGFVLKDLVDPAYNPLLMPEGDGSFDSSYDDMLVARVITNSSNAVTVTNLVNRERLVVSQIVSGTDFSRAGTNGANALIQHTLNWARRPTSCFLHLAMAAISSASDHDYNTFDPDAVNRNDLNAVSGAETTIPFDRYRLRAAIMCDFATQLSANFSASA